MKQILETELDRMYDHYIDLRCKVIHFSAWQHG